MNNQSQSAPPRPLKAFNDRVTKRSKKIHPLKKPLSVAVFITSMVTIFSVGLIFLGIIYYIVNPPQKAPLLFKDPVTTAPVSLTLNLTGPDDNKLVYEPELLIHGQSTPNATVLLSSENSDEIISTDQVGNFSKLLKLDKGINTIIVSAFDTYGNAKTEKRTIYYSTDKL